MRPARHAAACVGARVPCRREPDPRVDWIEVAKKRVHELAKERDMSPREMLAKLQAAGLPVKAVASAVDEKQANDALAGKKFKAGENGGSAPKQQPKAKDRKSVV